MMSAEFPTEVIPESFSDPCVSYDGNAEDFHSEVVGNCHSSHSLYNSSQFFDERYGRSFDSDSSHHSLLLEDPATGQDCLLEDERNGGLRNSRSNSYSCETNVHIGGSCIKILVKEPTENEDPTLELTSQSSPALLNHDVNLNVNKRPKLRRTGNVENTSQFIQGLFEPNYIISPPSSDTDSDRRSLPTPTPNYDELLTTPTLAYPGGEDVEHTVRGGEAAQLEGKECIPSTNRTRKQGQSFNHQVYTYLDNSDIRYEELNSAGGCNGISLSLLSRSGRPHYLESPPYDFNALSLPTVETRKLSDPVANLRRQRVKTTYEPRKQRCLSDSEAPSLLCSLDEDEMKSEEGASSALGGCDSGFHDERSSRYLENMTASYSSPRASQHSSDFLSLEETAEFTQRSRRVTPHPSFSLGNQESSLSDDQSSIHTSPNPGTLVHPRERSRRSLLKNFSQSSLGGTSSIGASSDSPSLSSVLETQSNLTGVTDILSSLGFDDFESPQLVPDRFIPKELEHLRPSAMKIASFEQNIAPDPPKSPDSLVSGQSSSTSHTPGPLLQQRFTEPSYLPLGATAENFLAYPSHPTSPQSSNSLPKDETPLTPNSPLDRTPLFTDTTAILGFTHSRVLETVPEETASDLSPSPRWLSPRVSIDHSVLEHGDKLGANLNVQKVRRRSLPTNRDGYRLSIGSQVESDTGDSIQLSVTSYDDEIAAERERERENFPPVHIDDGLLSSARRRRKGVYTPPQTLLSWLSTQKTIDEEDDTDPDELPWPFNEQARLRKSLTEISLAQKKLSSSEGPANPSENATETGSDNNGLEILQASSQHDISLSPISTPNARLSPQPAISEVDEDELLDQSHSCTCSPLHVADSSSSGTKPLIRAILSPNLQPESTPLQFDDAGYSDLRITASDNTTSDKLPVSPGSDSEATPVSLTRNFSEDPMTPASLSRKRRIGQFVPEPGFSESKNLHLPAGDLGKEFDHGTHVGGGSKEVSCTSSVSDAASGFMSPVGSQPVVPTNTSSGKLCTVSSIDEESSSFDDPPADSRSPLDTVMTKTVESRPKGLPISIYDIESLNSPTSSCKEKESVASIASICETVPAYLDLNTPVPSSCTQRPPLRKQMSADEFGQCAANRPHKSRRKPVFGEAPSHGVAGHLHTNQSLIENEKEVTKLMVL